jgi:hypothetical protein
MPGDVGGRAARDGYRRRKAVRDDQTPIADANTVLVVAVDPVSGRGPPSR